MAANMQPQRRAGTSQSFPANGADQLEEATPAAMHAVAKRQLGW